jgi:glutaredoxin 3
MNSIPSVVLYGTKFCPYCVAARMLLKSRGIAFENIPVDNDSELRAKISQKSGRTTVPQIWIGEQAIGGFTELKHMAVTGELDRLLSLNSTGCSKRSSDNN